MVGRITRTPRQLRHDGRHYASEAPTSMFGKVKGFALAGTGDALETLSRDKTKRVFR